MKPAKNWVSLALALTVLAAGATAQAQEKAATATKTASPFTYKVPLRGAPSTRVGGGTRGTEASLQVEVLAPGETGFTTQPQPTIYWYLSAPSDLPVEVTMAPAWPPEAASTPVLEVQISAPVESGVHAVNLSDLGVSLEPDMEYAWFVAVVKNPEQRADDIVAGGTIQLITLPPNVTVEAKNAIGVDRVAAFAQAGLWYDAIEELSKRISSSPRDRELRAIRASLLEQVGLTATAEYDRSKGS